MSLLEDDFLTQYAKAQLYVKNGRNKLKQIENSKEIHWKKLEMKCKEFLKNNKINKVLLILRNKKYSQKLLNNFTNKLLLIEQLLNEVSMAINDGNYLLNKLNNENTLINNEKLVEETKEAKEYQNKLSNILCNELTISDEEEVLEELKELYSDSKLEMLNSQNVLNGELTSSNIKYLLDNSEEESNELSESEESNFSQESKMSVLI